jgi:hypothetical protein
MRLCPSTPRLQSVLRYILEVEGPNIDEIESIELLGLPQEGEPIETNYGTCVVTRTEETPDAAPYAGKIYCRLP